MKNVILILLFSFLFGASISFGNSHYYELNPNQSSLVEYSKDVNIAQNEPNETNSESEKEPNKESNEDPISSFLGSNTVLYFFLGVLIPLGLFVILAISVKKKLPKKED